MNRLALRLLSVTLAIAGFAIVSLQLELPDSASDQVERPIVVAASVMSRAPLCASQAQDARISCITPGRGLRD